MQSGGPHQENRVEQQTLCKGVPHHLKRSTRLDTSSFSVGFACCMPA